MDQGRHKLGFDAGDSLLYSATVVLQKPASIAGPTCARRLVAKR